MAGGTAATQAKYRPYPAYKPSGVEWLGDIPEGWRLQPCRANVNHHMDKNSDGKSDNYLSLMANVGIIPYADKGDVGNKKPDDLSKCKIVRAGDLVINSMNYAIGSYGMSPYDGICSPVYIVLSVKPEKLLNRFALRVFENKPFQKHLAVFGNGILEHRAAIGWDTIKGQYMPVPPLNEQEIILGFLDHETAKIDGLIAKQQRLIALLEEKRQAVISHAVTKGLDKSAPLRPSGIDWLGDVPAHWEVVQARRIIQHMEQGKSPDCHNFPAGPNSWGVLKSGCINGGQFSPSENKELPDHIRPAEQYEVKIGDILMSRASGSVDLIGSVAYIEDTRPKLLLSDKTFRIKLTEQSVPKFFAKLMSAKYVRELIKQSISGAEGMANNITKASIFSFPLTLPPTNEQHDIVEFIFDRNNRFLSLIDKAQSAITLLKERRTALISAAVTGKIDLRDWQAPEGASDISTQDIDLPQEASA